MKVRIKERYLAIRKERDFCGIWCNKGEILLYPGMEFDANIVKDYGMFVDFELIDGWIDGGTRYERVSKRVFDELYDSQLSIDD